MLIHRSLPILAIILVAACAARAQMPERNGTDPVDRVSSLPKDALKFHIARHLDLGLFALDTQDPEATGSFSAFSREPFDADQVKLLVGRVGCGAGLRWTF